MSNFIYITLDTTAPSNPVIVINGGAIYATNQLVNLAVSVGDTDKTGYQMKIWGNVDETYNTNIKSLEANSSWMPFSTNPQIKLSSTDGAKTISMRVRDDVHNASAIAVDNITMDTAIPTVIVTTPDVSKISKVAGKDTLSFTFTANESFNSYSVKLVGSTGATHDSGQTIPSVGGSLNTSGATLVNSGQVITVTIKGIDLEEAGATSDGQHIIKVFVKDLSGSWSA